MTRNPNATGEPNYILGIAAERRNSLAQRGSAGESATGLPSASGATHKTPLTTQNSQLTLRFKSAIALFCAALREIFDESAYRRFLQRHDAQPSRASYAAFLRDHARNAYRPRCC